MAYLCLLRVALEKIFMIKGIIKTNGDQGVLKHTIQKKLIKNKN
jgi:hypothetical protein